MKTSLLLILAVLVSCKPAKKANDPEHVKEIEAWHERRVKRLKSPTGWLNLVGLHWLKEGVNTFGSDSSNTLVFPAKAPKKAGTLTMQKGRVTLAVEKNVSITVGGKSVATMELKDDRDSNKTTLEMGAFRFFVIYRNGEYAIRLRDLESPLLNQFTGTEMYPIDINWRVEARLETYDPPKIILVPTVLGTLDSSVCPGKLIFDVDGKEYGLEPIYEDGTDELFIIFGDATNASETYGGGRFVYARKPGADGKTFIDFNKAYNPPCVFTDYATCPLPPPQNKLPVLITAGEKKWGTKKH